MAWHSNNTCKHLPSDSGEHATRQKFQISHYWADLEQCFNLHMPPDFYLSTNLTQRPSATDNENVFKEIRGYPFVSFTASHLSQASQRSAHEATRLSRKDVSRDQKRATNPVSCALVSCVPWRFTKQGISRQSPTSESHKHVMSCTHSICKGLALRQIQQLSCTLSTIRALHARRIDMLQQLLSSGLKGDRDGSCISF